MSKAKWQATGNGQDVCLKPYPLMPTPRPESMGYAGAQGITGWNSSAGVSVGRGVATRQGQSELGFYKLLKVEKRLSTLKNDPRGWRSGEGGVVSSGGGGCRDWDDGSQSNGPATDRPQ